MHKAVRWTLLFSLIAISFAVAWDFTPRSAGRNNGKVDVKTSSPAAEFQLETLAIGAITIDPTDSSIVYVGTGENGQSADSFAGKGLYIIRNANSAMPNLNGPYRLNGVGADVFSGRAIGRILVVPSDHNTIFVCTANGTVG